MKKHGMSKSRPYRIWRGIHTRCTNPKTINWHLYGGKGVKICERWDEFENFWEDMKEGYSSEMTIDRIDGSGDYTPENCQWATKTQQARNRENNYLVTYKGETLLGREWDERRRFKLGTVRDRISKKGWPVEKAIETPVKQSDRGCVHFDKSRSRWMATVKRNGKATWLGRHKTKKEAQGAVEAHIKLVEGVL